MAARKRRPFTGLLLKAIRLDEVKPRGVRASLDASPDKSDLTAHISEALCARYGALDKFFGLQSRSENIWEQRAKAFLAYKFNIPAQSLQSWEALTRYLTGCYVPGFSLKGSGEKKLGAPLEWNFGQLAELFADVEFFKKNTGKSVSEICRTLPTLKGYVKRWGRYRGKAGGLRKAYGKAKKLRRQNFMFELQLCGPDALITGKNIDHTQAAIERHALRRP